MAGEPLLTIIGNATSDAELRFTPQGAAVAKFTVACTPRVKKGDQWSDGETNFYRCTAWRDMAEHCAESIQKGARLIVHGRFAARQYEKDGQTRTSLEIDVDEVGPSLRFAVARVQKTQRSSGNGGGPQSGGGGDDPWSTSAPSSADTARGGGFPEDPPF